MPPEGSHVEKIVINGDGTIEAHGTLDANWGANCLSMTILVTQRNGAIAQGAGAPNVPGTTNIDDEYFWSLELQATAGRDLVEDRKADVRAIGVMDSAGKIEVVPWRSRGVTVSQP